MTIYIAEQDRDTRYPLWYETYKCKIPAIQMRTIDDIRYNGTYISGNPAFDHASNWERILVQLPVVKMIEHWSNGANLYIVDIDKHARKIYNDCEAHLNAWARHMEGSYNTKKIPEEDLIMLDEFAQLMYAHAKWVEVSQYYEGILKPKKATPSRGALAAFWENLDKTKAAREEEDRNRINLEPETLSFGGIDYVKDTSRMMEELKKHMGHDHVGKNAVDIYSRRESFVLRMKESGYFSNYQRR